MMIGFLDSLKRERDISIKAMLSGGKPQPLRAFKFVLKSAIVKWRTLIGQLFLSIPAVFLPGRRAYEFVE